jgi:CheY-like chemotaxis protein
VEDVQTILVVDDEAEVRRLIVRQLRTAGFHVVEAANGEEALALIDGGLTPRVIVLDLWMPISDGWDFLARARPNVPVVVVSGLAGQITPLPPFVTKVVAKPFDCAQLVSAIQAAQSFRAPGH